MVFPMTSFSQRRRHTALSLALLCALPLSAAAQDSAATLPVTVVTATRTEQPLVDLVADVTVIDSAQIERSGASALADVLSQLPGLELVRNGGPGGSSSLYIRGAETRFTAVYVDGVRVDSQSTGGASWESIPLAQIDRIEVLRGPASAVYGSDAMGGVVQIFTRKGEGPFKPYAGVGLASYGSSQGEAGFSGRSGALDYALGVAAERSSGFNARPVTDYNPDDDGYRSQSGSARLGWQLNDAHRLDTTLLANNLDAQYDNSRTAPASTYDDHALHQLRSGSLGWQADWTDAYRSRLNMTDSRSRYETLSSGYLTDTHLRGYLWQNEYRQGGHLVTAALERREDQLENASTTPSQTARTQNGLALGYGWRGADHSLQLQARQDHDSEFGSQNTGSVAYGFALARHWRLTASAGTAFRAPTLFQLFSDYGNPRLQPERSRNIEAGLRYTEGANSWGLVAYRNTVSNQIAYSAAAIGTCAYAFGCYANVAQAEYLGVTLSGRQRVGETNLSASLDVQKPRDFDTGNLLARRASHHATLWIDTRMHGWRVGADAKLSGARYDNGGNTIVLPAYAVFNLHAQTSIGRDWRALLRLDNATDAQYQLADGYATAGRALFVGLKWAPQ